MATLIVVSSPRVVSAMQYFEEPLTEIAVLGSRSPEAHTPEEPDSRYVYIVTYT